MSHRLKQVESMLQRAISQVLQRHLADPRIGGLISVTRVKVSADIRHAQVGVSVIPATAQKKVLVGLQHASGHIHTLIRKLVALRTVPHLEFRLDESLKKQAAVFDAIQNGAQRSGHGESAPPPGSQPSQSPGPSAAAHGCCQEDNLP